MQQAATDRIIAMSCDLARSAKKVTEESIEFGMHFEIQKV
jgi:hypothetical protein